MMVTIVRTSTDTMELSPTIAQRWYLTEIIRLDPFQKEKPCFMDNFDKYLEYLNDIGIII